MGRKVIGFSLYWSIRLYYWILSMKANNYVRSALFSWGWRLYGCTDCLAEAAILAAFQVINKHRVWARVCFFGSNEIGKCLRLCLRRKSETPWLLLWVLSHRSLDWANHFICFVCAYGSLSTQWIHSLNNIVCGFNAWIQLVSEINNNSNWKLAFIIDCYCVGARFLSGCASSGMTTIW